MFPWECQVGDKDYQIQPWILKKVKEYVTIEHDNTNRDYFYLQKDKDRRLLMSVLQVK